MEENIEAVAVELTSGDLREIDSSASKITIEGARYPEQIEQMCRPAWQAGVQIMSNDIEGKVVVITGGAAEGEPAARLLFRAVHK